MAGSDVTDKVSTTVREAAARRAERPDGDREPAQAAYVRNDAAERSERRSPLGGEITLHGLLLTLRSGLWFVLLAAVAAILLAVIMLKREGPVYTATMVVAPAQQDLGAASRLVSQLDQYADLAALAQAPARLEAVTTMELYLELLRSPELARRLQEEHQLLQEIFPDQWDAASGSWHADPGIAASIHGAVLGFFGYPEWQPPTPANLAEYLGRRINVWRSGSTSLRRIAMSHWDGEFAARLLRLVHETADDLVREDAQRRVERQIAHLEQELAAGGEPTRAEALRSMLAEQYRAQAMLASDVPVAAQIVSPPTPSPGPTSTSPLLVLALAGVVGLILGVFAVFLVDALRKGT
jgi:LPS O-antigen subunit length determinant protein (WzzB/FepE family)